MWQHASTINETKHRSLVNKIVHNMNVAGPTKLQQEALITNLKLAD